jgi:flavodoxin
MSIVYCSWSVVNLKTMPQPVVLIIFSCQTGDTEKLALSAAVGAIQGRALIRLRRLPETDSASTSETLKRMRKEYVAPSETDIAGADVILLVSSPTLDNSTEPWDTFVTTLRKLQGKLEDKVRAAIGGIAPYVTDLGFVAFGDAMMDSAALGRSLAEEAAHRNRIEESFL